MTTAGEPEKWDATWRDADRLYTRNRPTSLRQFWHRLYAQDLWAEITRRGLGPTPHVLELGSGRGTTSMYMAARGCPVTLVDLSPTALERAAAAFRDEVLPPPTLVEADVRETGLPDAIADVVVNIGLLEHFDDPLPVLRESVRLLRPGGLLFLVVVPQMDDARRRLSRALFTPWRLLPEPLKARFRRTPAPRTTFHRTAYDREAWRRWLAQAGASDIEVLPYNPYMPTYKQPPLERWLTVPAYQLHHLWLRGHGLATDPRVALCDLLLASRP